LEILNEDNIYRRVPTYLPNFIKQDGTVTSLAFQLKRDEKGLSVNLERLSNYTDSVQEPSRFRLFQLNVGNIRSDEYNNLDVIYNELPENIAHSLITGEIKKNDSRKMARTGIEIFE
jgi:hypothetical protein